jgi:hypothetical protein
MSYYTIRDREFGTTFVFPTQSSPQELNPNPETLDPESECSDCGRFIEDGPKGICEYCNKRYQREAEIEKEIENDLY